VGGVLKALPVHLPAALVFREVWGRLTRNTGSSSGMRLYDRPGLNDCHADAKARDVDRERLILGLAGPLRSGLVAAGRESNAAIDRTDVDDAAIPEITHLWQHGLRDANGSKEVRLHHFAHQIQRHLLGDRGPSNNAGIVE
jgi:hypothetical protein